MEVHILHATTEYKRSTCTTRHLWGPLGISSPGSLWEDKMAEEKALALSFGREMGRWGQDKPSDIPGLGQTHVAHELKTYFEKVVEVLEMPLQSPEHNSGDQGWDLGTHREPKTQNAPQPAFASSLPSPSHHSTWPR